MEYLKIVITSVASISALFILAKLLGYRQVSQLSMFDYITGITIGSIAAEAATNLENFAYPMIAMLVYFIITYLISLISCKSIKLRRFFAGCSIIIYDNDMLYKDSLKRAKLDVNEFLTQCRVAGYFDISAIQTAIMEPNGKISFLPKNCSRPVSPGDLKITVAPAKPLYNVIIDGKVILGNLKASCHDMVWLVNSLKLQNISLDEVLLASCDDSNIFNVYKKQTSETKHDMFC